MNAVQPGGQQEQQDAAMLSSWMVRIFRHLARLLVGRMTLTHLLTHLREIFVEEAEAWLQRERPGRSIPLSQLALLTGLDTRTLIRIRADLAVRHLAGEEKARLSDLSSEGKVVEMWANNSRYADPRSGAPRPLSCNGTGSEFEDLVRRTVTARGVTVQAILERLQATGSVRLDRANGMAELLTLRYSPFNSEDEVSLMSNGLQAIYNLSGSVARNVNSPKEDRLIQRELWTYRLDPTRHQEFRDRLRKFLIEAENQAEGIMSPMESEFESGNQITAGVGFYYFEEDE